MDWESKLNGKTYKKYRWSAFFVKFWWWESKLNGKLCTLKGLLFTFFTNRSTALFSLSVCQAQNQPLTSFIQKRSNKWPPPYPIITALTEAPPISPSPHRSTTNFPINAAHYQHAEKNINCHTRKHATIDSTTKNNNIATHPATTTIPPSNNNTTATSINARPEIIIIIPSCVGRRIQIIGISLKIYHPPQ